MHKRRIGLLAAGLATVGLTVVPAGSATAAGTGGGYPSATALSRSYDWAAVARAQLAARQWTVVADRLNNPRGLKVSRTGALYDAQAGSGGQACSHGNCVGFTGAVTRVADGLPATILSGLVSGAGRDGSFATGPDDVTFTDNGKTVCVIETSAGRPNPPGLPPGAIRQLGKLLCYNAATGLRPVADLAEYEYENDPDGQGPDSNPYAVTTLPNGNFAVADAAGNDVVEVSPSGAMSTLAVLPNNDADANAVPTSLTVGPDHALYVGELGGEGGNGGTPAGGARVWRVDLHTGALTVYATGFTHISGIAFGPDGSLYVTELTTDPTFQSPYGDVMRVMPDGSRSRMGRKLVFPAGVAVGSDGSVYVNNASVLPAYTPTEPPFFGLHGQLVKLTTS